MSGGGSRSRVVLVALVVILRASSRDKQLLLLYLQVAESAGRLPECSLCAATGRMR